MLLKELLILLFVLLLLAFKYSADLSKDEIFFDLKSFDTAVFVSVFTSVDCCGCCEKLLLVKNLFAPIDWTFFMVSLIESSM